MNIIQKFKDSWFGQVSIIGITCIGLTYGVIKTLIIDRVKYDLQSLEKSLTLYENTFAKIKAQNGNDDIKILLERLRLDLDNLPRSDPHEKIDSLIMVNTELRQRERKILDQLQKCENENSKLTKTEKATSLQPISESRFTENSRVDTIKPLRFQPRSYLSQQETEKMIKERGFFNSSRNRDVKTIDHKYEEIYKLEKKLVIDQKYNLMWQHKGSVRQMPILDAYKYIKQMNTEKYAGFDDWRLPTLEEALSLMAPQKHLDLYLDPIFDQLAGRIWTADRHIISYTRYWVVNFDSGSYYGYSSGKFFVRAVRTPTN